MDLEKVNCSTGEQLTKEEELFLSQVKGKRKFVPCNRLHYGKCYVRHLQVFCVVFFKAMKLYWPLHVIPVLISLPSVIKQLQLIFI